MGITLIKPGHLTRHNICTVAKRALQEIKQRDLEMLFTAGRRSTHSTKMMRSGLRRAAVRRAKRVTSCCCTTADGKESTGQYKNRPHLFETGAKQWIILGTCWRAYGTNDSGRDRFCASLFKGKWHRMGKKNSLYMRAV
ncbi:hypothetical protein T4E_11858 [Trichinella pseudospiralis]|uniref:Uncharacterized protein n=1 Tax=Trichinella pseudospiralis TaxID=6337 RepID=A0A0V0XE96_TRIPS|nr:hypothetical protein T4E_11858 [Trichinella pseudospiralis]